MDDHVPGVGMSDGRDDCGDTHHDGLAPRAAVATPGPCPACSSARVIPILYGSPSSDMIAAYAAGLAAIGGVVARDGAPRWACRDCDHRWGDAAPDHGR
jgi:hypothetical protein